MIELEFRAAPDLQPLIRCDFVTKNITVLFAQQVHAQRIHHDNKKQQFESMSMGRLSPTTPGHSASGCSPGKIYTVGCGTIEWLLVSVPFVERRKTPANRTVATGNDCPEPNRIGPADRASVAREDRSITTAHKNNHFAPCGFRYRQSESRLLFKMAENYLAQGGTRS